MGASTSRYPTKLGWTGRGNKTNGHKKLETVGPTTHRGRGGAQPTEAGDERPRPWPGEPAGAVTYICIHIHSVYIYIYIYIYMYMYNTLSLSLSLSLSLFLPLHSQFKNNPPHYIFCSPFGSTCLYHAVQPGVFFLLVLYVFTSCT